jgi:hypothetical protein
MHIFMVSSVNLPDMAIEAKEREAARLVSIYKGTTDEIIKMLTIKELGETGTIIAKNNLEEFIENAPNMKRRDAAINARVRNERIMKG